MKIKKKLKTAYKKNEIIGKSPTIKDLPPPPFGYNTMPDIYGFLYRII